MGRRAVKIARVLSPAGTAVGFWSINALAMTPRLANPEMVRPFLWNVLLLAVVVTTASAASGAWGIYAALRHETTGTGCHTALVSLMMSLLAALGGLLVGWGITWAFLVSSSVGSAADLIGRMRLLGLFGIAFALVGAAAGSASASLAMPAPEHRRRKARLAAVGQLFLVNALWVAAVWFALAAARDIGAQ
jgi:hypothetical protein